MNRLAAAFTAGIFACLSLTSCVSAQAAMPQKEAPSASIAVVPLQDKGMPQQETAVPALPVTMGKEGKRFFLSSQVQGSPMSITSLEEFPCFPAEEELTLTVSLDGQELFSGSQKDWEKFQPRASGLYRYTVKRGTGTGAVYTLEVKASLPPTVTLSQEKIKFGETMAIYVDNAEDLEVSAVTNLSYRPKFYETGWGKQKMAMLPVSYFTTPGTYSLTVQIGEQPYHYSIVVENQDFVVQNLTVDQSVADSTINSNAASLEWNQKIEPLKYITDPQKYWDGPFLLPVDGRITTEFGTIRYTNGSKTASRHGAVDIAAPTGTPVPAANRGRVIFAQYIQMSGNVVVIEHGLGVKTWYFHMSSIDVEEGQMVEKGDLIGKVGATGFVTGPHLHFGMSVNEVYVNPWTAIEQGIG